MNEHSSIPHKADDPNTLKPSMVAQTLALIVSIALPLTVGFLGSQATIENVDGWYATADKAPWTPPNSVFSPVWIALYIAMGIAVWLIWRTKNERNVSPALWMFGVQLLLNGLWTPAFFGLYPHLGSAALWIAMAIIAILIVAVTVTIMHFRKISHAAAWLLVPYLAWLIYASTLNLYAAIFN